MKIAGLQKTTLLDFPGKVACTIFIEGCHLRCPFCHNGDLVLPGQDPSSIPLEEVLSFLTKRKGLLDGVCVTGGEPLMHPEVLTLLKQIKEKGYAVKLDTNGFFPDRLREAVEGGLVDMVAMDVKNCLSKYPETTGIPGISTAPVEQSVHFLKAGNIPFEFRTTVVKELHTKEDLVAVARWLSGEEPYFLQSFVDSGRVIREGLHPWEPEALKAVLKEVKAYLPNASLRGI